ncbi:MAG TPA: GspMb/PilO family protein, partial [Gemmatimonadaceae bacterium]|nr:GspMb/PilO family protein [Gemmatimonadaceae bacterium]
ADLPTFPATRRTLSHQLEREASRLFQASNDLVATGDLAQYVQRVAKATGVQLQQTETRPTHPVLRDLQALQLEVHAEGDLDGILHFLHQLEIGDKLVRVADLTIDAGRGTLDTSRMHGVEVLSISANIYGYRLSGTQWQSVETRDDGASPFTHVASSNASLDAVLNHDPFNPTRTRPSQSYRLAMLQRGQPVRQRRQPPHFRLIGTVTSAHDVNFAMIQEDGGTPPQTVSVGEHIDDYTLISLRRDVAVLAAHDGTHLELRADEAGFAPSDAPLSVNSQSGVSIRIEKDPTGTLQVARDSRSGGRGMLMFSGPNNDSVYAQVDGPTGWGGDTGKFLLATDGKGNCCRTIQMTQPGNYVYQIWDKSANVIRQGTIVMEQP